jgi:hypothetical protein
MSTAARLIQALVRDGDGVVGERLPRLAGLEPLAEGNGVCGDGTERAWHRHRALRIVPRTHLTWVVVLGVLHRVFEFRQPGIQFVVGAH